MSSWQACVHGAHAQAPTVVVSTGWALELWAHARPSPLGKSRRPRLTRWEALCLDHNHDEVGLHALHILLEHFAVLDIIACRIPWETWHVYLQSDGQGSGQPGCGGQGVGVHLGSNGVIITHHEPGTSTCVQGWEWD